jgi:hypothetical protein
MKGVINFSTLKWLNPNTMAYTEDTAMGGPPLPLKEKYPEFFEVMAQGVLVSDEMTQDMTVADILRARGIVFPKAFMLRIMEHPEQRWGVNFATLTPHQRNTIGRPMAMAGADFISFNQAVLLDEILPGKAIDLNQVRDVIRYVWSQEKTLTNCP